MMLQVAWQMLAHRPVRSLMTVCGLGILFFLSAAQVGLLVGWCRTCTALIRNAAADVWVMSEQTPAFDYGTAIPHQRLYQVRSVPGVAWAEGLFLSWVYWQCPDGRQVNVEMIGLDDSDQGGPWAMHTGDVSAVHLPDAVVVDELYLKQLGVRQVGDTAEVLGRRAVVRGICTEARTFTTSPYVFTSLRAAVDYDQQYERNSITYVLARAAPGVSAEDLARSIRRVVPHVEVLTARDFSMRTMLYWMLETGIGLTVVLTALLGFTVSALVVSQTLFALTQEHLPQYVTLLALGFRRGALLRCILWQSLLLSAGSVVVGSGVFFAAAQASRRTVIPIETTPLVFLALVALQFLCAAAGGRLASRGVLSANPASVFRG